MDGLRNVKWLVLILCLLILAPEALPQNSKPIDKAAFLKVARDGTFSASELIQFIVERKVDFRLNADEEQELAKLPEGSKLIDAVRNNYVEVHPPPPPLPDGPPLDANQVVTLLQAEVDPSVVVKLVLKRAVSFSMDDLTLSRILAAGGTTELVGAIFTKFIPPPKAPSPDPPSGDNSTVVRETSPVSMPIYVQPAQQRDKLIYVVEPKYTDDAQTHKPKSIVFRVTIGADGKVKDTRVVGDRTAFDKVAESAVRQWRYKKTMQNGIPVEVTTYVAVGFNSDKKKQ